MLLDASAGAAVLAGPDLARMLGGRPGVQQELMRFQVETATRVCTSLDDLGRELARLRRLVAGAAASLGGRLVASGIAPYRAPGLAAVTDQPRYRELARRYGPLAAEAGSTCGCHVHVGVPSRDPRRPGAGAAAALACLAARHHRQLTDRGRPRHGLGELASWRRSPSSSTRRRAASCSGSRFAGSSPCLNPARSALAPRLRRVVRRPGSRRVPNTTRLPRPARHAAAPWHDAVGHCSADARRPDPHRP